MDRLPISGLPYSESDMLAMRIEEERWAGKNEAQFAIASGATDHVDNEAKKGVCTFFLDM